MCGLCEKGLCGPHQGPSRGLLCCDDEGYEAMLDLIPERCG